MTYKVTYLVEQNEQYPFGSELSDTSKCKHCETSQYEVEGQEGCLRIVRDVLDVPLAELTLDEIKKDFQGCSDDIGENKLVAIQNYYNGRFALWNQIQSDISTTLAASSPLRYDIPEKYNTFTMSDDSKQVQSFIEIQRLS